MVMSPVGHGTKNNCAGENQQQVSQSIAKLYQRIRQLDSPVPGAPACETRAGTSWSDRKCRQPTRDALAPHDSTRATPQWAPQLGNSRKVTDASMSTHCHIPLMYYVLLCPDDGGRRFSETLTDTHQTT
jgi:hypothetical protein